MKRITEMFLAAALVLACCFTAGCASDQPASEYTPADLRSDVNAAVGTFAAFRLASNPDGRSAWISAESGLSSLVAQERWSVSAFAEAFAVAGADKIEDQRIRLVLENGLVIVTTLARGRVNLEDPVWARAVIEGARDAIQRVLRVTAPKS